MSTKLTIGLPVMLHQEKEIQAFLAAKERIEKYGDSIGRPLNVGAFLFFIPPAMKEANLAKQLENQEKYRLPIVHAQSTFQSRHCLAFNAEQDPESGGKDLMDLVVNQTAALREYDPIKNPVDVSVNVGLYLCRTPIEPKSPVIYTLDEFLQKKEELFNKSVRRFSRLEQLAHSKNLRIAVENGVTASYAPHVKLPDKNPRMFIHPFNDLRSMNSISNSQLVLDTAHWAGTLSAPKFFEKNKAYDDKAMLFKMEGIDSWEAYHERNPSLSEYFPYTCAFHIGNATGCGLYLDDALKEQWGDVGVAPEGIVSRQEFHGIVRYAEKHQRPLIVEADYNIKNMETNQYREADPMIAYMLTSIEQH